MSVPSMVHRSGDTLVVRSVVSGDALFGSADYEDKSTDEIVNINDKDLPECKVKRNYSCTSCDFFTQNPRHYLYHLRDVHKEKVRIYECPNCLYASKHFQKLLRHTKMVHGSADGVQAPESSCSRKSKKRAAQVAPVPVEESEPEEFCEVQQDSDGDYALDETVTAVHNEKTIYKCSLCTFIAKTQSQLSKHEREEHIKTKFFRCSKCTYVTHMKARFTKHVKYHSMPMIKCDMCDFRTPYKWNLDRHCKNHNGQGAFGCSACNFRADIKQSLTVHEMNHHVPPVGQAAGLGVGRRRNKVGASDTTAAEEAAQVQIEPEQSNGAPSNDEYRKTHRLKIPAKKYKSANNQEHSGVVGSSFGPDFIHPDDIIHHANGNVYIKNKCRFSSCNYKTAWDSEMTKHEEKAHGLLINIESKPKKTSRPIPNLIPLPITQKVPQVRPKNEPIMSQKDINDICAKSANSSLKDFASLFGSEDVFPQESPKIPDLIPTRIYTSTPKNRPDFKQKHASFFDKIKEKITNSGDTCNLTCQFCGHESKCLTESVLHQKVCGKEQIQTANIIPMHNLSSTRCQHCRQRCKSSTDLYNHLQTCAEAEKFFARSDNVKGGSSIVDDVEITPEEDDLNTEDSQGSEKEPHPMENKVFVWNNIVVPMDIEIDEPNQYEYIDDKTDDNLSLDLSIRTQSPNSESSYIGVEITYNNNNYNNNITATTTTSDKVPTHGNDISVAQHKRVFKCPHCTFWASTASRFHVHIVGHLNKKPFECSLCAYRSNWRWDITKHIKLKSVRDPAHESAKVLMTDETGRRNYTKYNKYLTEIHVSGDNETSGGSGTRPKNHNFDGQTSQVNKQELPKQSKVPSSNDFSPVMKGGQLRPPPGLKAADEAFFSKLSSEKKKNDKKTLWQCKKCNFRDPCHDKLLAHVKSHYQQQQQVSSLASVLSNQQQFAGGPSTSGDTDSEASFGGGGVARGQAPFRCGHCHQVSNWKHVIQRHCRLKHRGDIKVIVGTKNSSDKIEIEYPQDNPTQTDVLQTGTYKCEICPFSNEDQEEFDIHMEGHSPSKVSITKCIYCPYYVSQKEDLYQHLKLHGLTNPAEYMTKLEKHQEAEPTKRYKCLICPYLTNSKSQYMYHKQFHKPRNGQYNCTECTYNVSKRHLLHQHMKVHGINISPQKQNGEIIDLEEISDEIEEIHHVPTFDSMNLPEIPLVWVSKSGKVSKMYKCRYCPHVNLRKVNIQEHEKMHGVREKNPARGNEIEHRCPDCNYVCNNAGVLSSHSKVHQGQYGVVHCIVDPTKSDEEQIRELSRFLQGPQIVESINLEEDVEMQTVDAVEILYFCNKCPARFLKENEFQIHTKFHGVRLSYKCEYCTYTARQKPHLLAHNKVHTYEYRERTKILIKQYKINPQYPQPNVILCPQNSDNLWVVDDPSTSSSDIEMDIEPPISCRNRFSVPLSGTDLFQQKSEAEAEATEQMIDRQHSDTFMNDQGNPDFIYPTLLKNGRVKDKRYKCNNCPSAFEKREQFKVHLSLHGSNQQYKCQFCDYSVKYYANFVQHEKKHKLNNNAQAALKTELEMIEEPEDLTQSSAKKLKTEQRRSSGNKESEEKKLFWCPMCPYTNYRKDAVDNHQKRHVTISGLQNNYTCEHCDYSVPQAHFLRDHIKLHFLPNKVSKPEGYMSPENLTLTGKMIKNETDTDDAESDENLIFDDKGDNIYEPPLSVETLNNNEGEKMFVNTTTGEMVEKQSTNQNTESISNSQISSDIN